MYFYRVVYTFAVKSYMVERLIVHVLNSRDFEMFVPKANTLDKNYLQVKNLNPSTDMTFLIARQIPQRAWSNGSGT